MLRKTYTPVSMFLEALALLIVGILFLTNPEGMLKLAVSAVHILAWIAALNSLFVDIIRFLRFGSDVYSS